MDANALSIVSALIPLVASWTTYVL